MPEFNRYRDMLTKLASRGLAEVPLPLDASADGTVLLGVAAARALIEDNPGLDGMLVNGMRRLAALGGSSGEQAPMLRDAGGHARSVYLPLVVHLHLRAFAKRYERMNLAHWSACEECVPGAIAPMRAAEAFTASPPDPQETHLVLWQALCVSEQATLLSRDVDSEWVEAVVHQIATRPGEHGSLHPWQDCEGDSLDHWTYRELVGLHALADLALRRRNAAWARRVQEVAMFHVERTQPDHVTSQPWGVFAFVWSPGTEIFAQQQLHDATAYGITAERRAVAPISAMLLADAADAMAAFEA